MRLRAGPIPVERLGEIRFAVFERGRVRFVERVDADGRPMRDARDLRSKPAATELIEQRIDPVHGAALAPAGDNHMASRRLQDEPLRAQFAELDAGMQRL